MGNGKWEMGNGKSLARELAADAAGIGVRIRPGTFPGRPPHGPRPSQRSPTHSRSSLSCAQL